jgi:hypothetical protein
MLCLWARRQVAQPLEGEIIVKIVATAALLAVALGGCAPAGPSPEQIAAAQSDLKACDPLPTHVERARCRNGVFAKYGNHGDLANVIATERVALAEKQDAGTMTQAEADAEFARVFASVNTEDQQRRAAILASMPVSCTSVGATTTCY